jgi:hypothetical protein
MTSDKLKTRTGTITGWIIILLILCQFVPLNRIGYPSKTPTAIPDSVFAILQTHCLDCHSGETRWPKSAWIAPLSWYVTGKVHQARKLLDLSDYDDMTAKERLRIRTTVSGFARPTDLAGHARIPGFPPLRLKERERLILEEWSSSSNNNREPERTINNSSHR